MKDTISLKENLINVESSTISKIGHFDSLLYVEFKGGQGYFYVPVNKNLYEEFKSSESKGKFFAEKIKNNESITCIKKDLI